MSASLEATLFHDSDLKVSIYRDIFDVFILFYSCSPELQICLKGLNSLYYPGLFSIIIIKHTLHIPICIDLSIDIHPSIQGCDLAVDKEDKRCID